MLLGVFLNAESDPYTVKLSLFLKDHCLWISRITLTHKITSPWTRQILAVHKHWSPQIKWFHTIYICCIAIRIYLIYLQTLYKYVSWFLHNKINALFHSPTLKNKLPGIVLYCIMSHLTFLKVIQPYICVCFDLVKFIKMNQSWIFFD